METLLKFRVGIDRERFYNHDSGEWESFDSIYFPLFAPLSEKQAQAIHNK
jgi:hypothetical protein